MKCVCKFNSAIQLTFGQHEKAEHSQADNPCQAQYGDTALETHKIYTDEVLARLWLYFGLISKLFLPLATLPALDLLPINKFDYVAGFTRT